MTDHRSGNKKRQAFAIEQRDRTRRKLALLKVFLSEHPVAGIKRSLVLRGLPVGAFALACRYRHKQGVLSSWLTSELEAIPGWTWDPPPRTQVEETPNVKRLREYVEAHGWEGISRSTVFDGSPIGAWISNCRSDYRGGRLSQNLRAGLEAIPGWTWGANTAPKDPYPNVTRLRAYVQAHCWDNIRNTTILDGSPIGRWITNVRAEYRRGRLTKGLTEALESIPGWSWGTSRTRSLRHVLVGIRRFVNLHGWSAITKDMVIEGVQADLWLNTRRSAYREGRLAPWLVNALEVIPGWSWSATHERYHFRDMTKLLAAYVSVHGWTNLEWDTTFRSARIGGFVQECIFRHLEGLLSVSTRDALLNIPGWSWDQDVSTSADRRILLELKAHLKAEGWGRIREWIKFQETRLGRWLRFCRSRRTRNHLPEKLRRDLERLPGWTWEFGAVRGPGKHAVKSSGPKGRSQVRSGTNRSSQTSTASGGQQGQRS